jgi:hypothetical protein
MGNESTKLGDGSGCAQSERGGGGGRGRDGGGARVVKGDDWIGLDAIISLRHVWIETRGDQTGCVW